MIPAQIISGDSIMPECRKCRKMLEIGWVACPWCGTLVTVKPRKTKARGNGQGTAYQRGRTWTAKVIIRWEHIKNEDGTEKLLPVSKTKGGFRSKTEALQYCEVMRKSPTKVESNDTFAQIYDRWYKFYKGRIKSTTMACYKAAFKYYASIQHYRMVTITADDLQRCIDECSKGRSTKDDMRTVCSLVFKYAMQNGIVDVNQAQFLFAGKEKKGKRPPFSMAELETIRKAIGQYSYADYVYFLCYTGFRPNEFLSLKKEAYHEVELDGKKVPFLIGGFKTEAGTDRVVTISPKIQSILDTQMKREGEYIFPNIEDGTMMDDEYFRKKCFKPLMEQLGIDGKVPYSCRHTFADLLKQVYGSDTDKAELIGHADASMTKYYQSADYASMKKITDAL